MGRMVASGCTPGADRRCPVSARALARGLAPGPRQRRATPARGLDGLLARPVAMWRVASTAVLRLASFMALAAICWNCCVSEPHSCKGVDQRRHARGGGIRATTAGSLGLCAVAAARRGLATLSAAPDRVLAAWPALSAARCALHHRIRGLELEGVGHVAEVEVHAPGVARVIFCTSSALDGGAQRLGVLLQPEVHGLELGDALLQLLDVERRRRSWPGWASGGCSAEAPWPGSAGTRNPARTCRNRCPSCRSWLPPCADPGLGPRTA